MSLGGKHALVTGGGTGIGAAIALTLAQADIAVTICGRRAAMLESSAARHKNIHGIAADVTDETSVALLYKQAEAARGPIDIVIANAGGAQAVAAEKVSAELWTQTINVNLTGAFFTVRPALPGMRERGWGRVVFVASTAGLKAYSHVAPYVAAKHGVIGLMRALALELARTAVTVNAVCPGYTETPLLEQAVSRVAASTKHGEADARKVLAAHNPQRRFIEPQEVADVVLWLCGTENASITGQAISVSGGETW